MLELDKEVFDIASHANATAPAHVVPFDVDSCKLISQHVELHSMVFFEEILQVVEVEVFKADVFHPKVVHK